MNYRKKGLSIALITGLALGCTTPTSATPTNLAIRIAGISGPISGLTIATQLVKHGYHVGAFESSLLFPLGIAISYYLTISCCKLMEKLGIDYNVIEAQSPVEGFKMSLMCSTGVLALCAAANVIGNDPNL